MTSPPRLPDFAGTWDLARRIEDRVGPGGNFQGRAVLAVVDGGLSYHETGTLYLHGNPPVAGTRIYHWRGDGGWIAVAFADGRPFHRFDPASLAPTARHDCSPDLYLVRYDFARWPLWSAEWQVKGPRKDYVMTTDYQPGPEPARKG